MRWPWMGTDESFSRLNDVWYKELDGAVGSSNAQGTESNFTPRNLNQDWQ